MADVTKLFSDELVAGAAIRDGEGRIISDNYATKTELSAVETLVTTLSEDIVTTLTTYATKSDVTTLSNNVATTLTTYATKEYVGNTYLPLTGGSMLGDITMSSGNLYMGQHSIMGVSSINVKEINMLDSKSKIVGVKHINGLENPLANNEAANKLYVDTKVSTLSSNIATTLTTYATKDYVTTELTVKADKSEVATTLTSYATQNYVTTALTVKADLATVYTKGETYNKDEVDTLISVIPKFAITVVDELPATGDPATVYLVRDTQTGTNMYTEYIYVNNKWEMLGTQETDLSNYYNKQEIDTKVSAINTSITNVSNTVTSVSARVTTLETTATSLSSRVGTLETTATSLSSRVGALETNKQDKLSAAQISAINDVVSLGLSDRTFTTWEAE